MPKILLEHQLPTSAAPHRRRHSSNTYLGLSTQKRQRLLTAVGAAVIFLTLLALSRAGSHAREDAGYSRASEFNYRVPPRAQGGRPMFGGWKAQDVGEYDADGEEASSMGKELDGDALEAELGLLNQAEESYAPPPEPVVPDNLQPDAIRRQLKALTYFLADHGVLPTARGDIDPDKELTLKYLAEIGSGFEAPDEDLDWDEYIVANYPLVVFSKSYCPYSKKAKHYLNSVGAAEPAFVIEVDLRPDADTLKYVLGRLTERSTFPNVILGFEPLGGGDDVELLHAEGGLARVLQEGGVRFPRARIRPF